MQTQFDVVLLHTRGESESWGLCHSWGVDTLGNNPAKFELARSFAEIWRRKVALSDDLRIVENDVKFAPTLTPAKNVVRTNSKIAISHAVECKPLSRTQQSRRAYHLPSLQETFVNFGKTNFQKSPELVHSRVMTTPAEFFRSEATVCQTFPLQGNIPHLNQSTGSQSDPSSPHSDVANSALRKGENKVKF